MGSMQTTRRTREQLRATLVEEGREILLTEGLESGSSNLTFKRVFARVEAKTGVRVTNASVIKRIWRNQADYQTDVVISIARDEARRAEGSGQRVTALLSTVDTSTVESRTRALGEACRVEGNASSAAIDRSANWRLWIGIVAMAVSRSAPADQARIMAALDEGYQAVTALWCANIGVVMGLLGFRVRAPWTIDDLATASIALAEGCALRQLTEDDAPMVVRPTGPCGEAQEWSRFAVGFEALAYQYLQPDPDLVPPQADQAGTPDLGGSAFID
jgi:hypothetical protein